MEKALVAEGASRSTCRFSCDPEGAWGRRMQGARRWRQSSGEASWSHGEATGAALGEASTAPPSHHGRGLHF